MPAMLIVYTLATCDTCRRATRWLRANHVAFEERAIRITPPGRAELRSGLVAVGGDVRKLFNRSGREYRAQDLAAKLPQMTEPDALALLAGNGSLVKRPFAVGDGVALVGFDEVEWARVLR
jgi:arsenate reductase (glutaredoxin)